MRTVIQTAHEETYNNSDDLVERTMGILMNYCPNDPNFRESLVYIYRKGMYIFFNTIVDCIDYLFYGNDKMKRAYMEEVEFDIYYDAEYIDGKFCDKLEWCS